MLKLNNFYVCHLYYKFLFLGSSSSKLVEEHESQLKQLKIDFEIANLVFLATNPSLKQVFLFVLQPVISRFIRQKKPGFFQI